MSEQLVHHFLSCGDKQRCQHEKLDRYCKFYWWNPNSVGSNMNMSTVQFCWWWGGGGGGGGPFCGQVCSVSSVTLSAHLDAYWLSECSASHHCRGTYCMVCSLQHDNQPEKQSRAANLTTQLLCDHMISEYATSHWCGHYSSILFLFWNIPSELKRVVVVRCYGFGKLLLRNGKLLLRSGLWSWLFCYTCTVIYFHGRVSLN
jgi:hypothetical protein